MKREERRAYAMMFAWIILASPTLFFGGLHFWGVPGALTGLGVVMVVYYWRYWIFINKSNLVFFEERITRERTGSETS